MFKHKSYHMTILIKNPITLQFNLRQKSKLVTMSWKTAHIIWPQPDFSPHFLVLTSTITIYHSCYSSNRPRRFLLWSSILFVPFVWIFFRHLPPLRCSGTFSNFIYSRVLSLTSLSGVSSQLTFQSHSTTLPTFIFWIELISIQKLYHFYISFIIM